MEIKVWLPQSRPYGGTGLYRLRMPHEILDDNVTFTESINYNDLLCDILVVSKAYFTSIMPVLDRLKKAGVKVMIDFDDYWIVPQDHLLYPQYRKFNTTNILIQALRDFDYVITTTDLLYNEIRRINKNVVILENAINPALIQFEPKPSESDKIRFGWIGGHCHLPDIKLLEGVSEQLNHISQNWNINLFGHDGQLGGLYDQFAYILSPNMKTKDKLNVFRAASSDTYTQFYNLIDVCLIPLVDNKFNSMKSELKLVEAAFFKKAVVCSDVMPYKQWLTDKNSIRCGKRDWFKCMKKLIDNPNMAKDLGEQLYLDLNERFNLWNVNKRRSEYYRSIL